MSDPSSAGTRLRLVLASLATMIAAPPAAAGAQQAPPARWEVDWGERYCTLGRRTDGAAPLIFGLRTVPGSGWLEILLLGPAEHVPNFGEGRKAAVSAEPAGERIESEAFGGWARAKGQRFARIRSIPWSFIEASAGAKALRVDGAKIPVRISPAPSAKVIAALRQCEAGVLKDWGVDAKAMAALQAQPESRRPFLSSGDYPSSALEKGASGTVVARLLVGTDGNVEECVVVSSSGNEALDKKTCQAALNRGRYTPAVGSDGKPTAAHVITPVIWWLDEG